MATLDELQQKIRGLETQITSEEAELAQIPEVQKGLRENIANLKKRRAETIAEMRKALPAGIVRTRKARAATTT